jgi:hypothetical protein
MFLLNVGWLSTGPHGVTSPKTELFLSSFCGSVCAVLSVLCAERPSVGWMTYWQKAVSISPGGSALSNSLLESPGPELVAAVTMKNVIIWDVTSFPRNQHEASSNTKQLCCWNFRGLVCDHEDGGISSSVISGKHLLDYMSSNRKWWTAVWNYNLLGDYTVWLLQEPTFRRIVSPPSSYRLLRVCAYTRAYNFAL